MSALDITSEERSTGKLSAVRLEEAVRAVRQEGYVLLNDLIDPLVLAPIRDVNGLPKQLSTHFLIRKF